MREFPFTVDRMLPKSLTRQVVDGFVQAIRFGVYKPGDSLPSFREVVTQMHVSEIVVRAAYRQLASEGLIVSRPRVGSLVLPQGERVWRGHVLLLMTDFDFNFAQCGVVGPVRDSLMKAGYRVSQVIVRRNRRRKLDLSFLKAANVRPIDIIVQVAGEQETSRRLSESGLPFIVIGGGREVRDLSGCVGIIGFSSKKAFHDFSVVCRKAHISTVEIVCCERLSKHSETLMKVLDGIGVSVSARWLGGPWGMFRMESAERKGYEFVIRNAKRQNFHWPDLYFVTDDYVARGMLMAFATIGVKIPEDVRFVCAAPRGVCPVFCKSLSRMEFDAYTCGEESARRILAWLDHRRPFPNTPIESRFVAGETFF